MIQRLEPRRLLSFTLPSLTADADANGTVNLADFTRLAAHFNSAHAARPDGDFNFDGTVDLTDFTILAATFGQTATASPGDGLITQGGTYTGGWYPHGIRIRTTEPVTIDGATVANPVGDAINVASGSRVTITRTLGTSSGYFFDSVGAASVAVTNCSAVGTAGVGIYDMTGPVSLVKSTFENLKGAPGADHDQTHIILDGVHSAQVEIAWNRIINLPGQSAVEDNINCYSSSGTAASPIRIHDNLVVGAYPADPLSSDFSGGGIIADYNASFVRIASNIVVNTTNYGVQIASGHDNVMADNTVIFDEIVPATNVGIAGWDSYHLGSAAFYNNTAIGNRAYTANHNDWWFQGVTSTGGVHLPATTAAQARASWEATAPKVGA